MKRVLATVSNLRFHKKKGAVAGVPLLRFTVSSNSRYRLPQLSQCVAVVAGLCVCLAGEMRTLSIAVLGNPHPWAPQPVTPTSTLSHAAAPEGSMLGVVGIGPICWMLLSGALAMAAFRRVRKFRS